MNNLRKLSGTVILTLFLTLPALAGETSTPPGETNSPPCAPGETSAPPCSSLMASADASIAGEILTPPAAESFDFLSVAETALALIF